MQRDFPKCQHQWKCLRQVAILALAFVLPASAQDPNSLPNPQPSMTEQGQPAPAGGSGTSSSEPSVLHRFLDDEYKLWTSPFRPGNYDSHTAKKYVLPFALISGALIATDTHTASILSNSDQQTKWSGRVS